MLYQKDFENKLKKAFVKKYEEEENQEKLKDNGEKFNFLYDFIINRCYCNFDIFLENIGGVAEVKKQFKKLNTKGDFKNLVLQYI